MPNLFAEFSSVPMSTAVLLAAIGLGSLLAFFGIWRAMSEKNVAAERIAAHGKNSKVDALRSSLINEAYSEPSGFLASLSPKDASERFQVSNALARAGFRSGKAVASFYLVRIVLGIGLPGGFLALQALANSSAAWVPAALSGTLGGMSAIGLVQALALLAAVGFFGPSYWLNGLVAARKRRIEEAFPNALDLIQIAVEAGMGFDAAMTRVASEIHHVAPDLAEEFLLAQSEIQAGRDRDRALYNLGHRCGVEEVSAFAAVVVQSMQFGTPVTDTLAVYSDEMRQAREMRAQEKANKLPVLMSAVMAVMMLPAILMLTVGPVVIRYVEYFASR